jgi:hypothetical protein
MENDNNFESQNKKDLTNNDLNNNIDNFQNLLNDEENIEENEFDNNNINEKNENNINNNNINEMKTENLLQLNLNLTYFKENEQRAFYIDTIIISSHVSYLIKGKNLKENSLERRYREFDALHNVLIQKWPGIYIPPIPKKQIINNTDTKTIEKRKNVLDNFLKEILTNKFTLWKVKK